LEQLEDGRAARRRPGPASGPGARRDHAMARRQVQAYQAACVFVGKRRRIRHRRYFHEARCGAWKDMKRRHGAAAACVTGLIVGGWRGRKGPLSMRVGLIGLVENMPSGPTPSAPGDIVTSMSGQTIEGAQYGRGRTARPRRRTLVRAGTLQATPYCRSRHADRRDHRRARQGNTPGCSPMTTSWPGNSAPLARRPAKKVWRMPLGKAYDKLIDSKNADMKNIGGRLRAARSRRRNSSSVFVKDTPWAHLDVAGTAMDAIRTDISQTWASRLGRSPPSDPLRGRRL